MKNNRLYYYDFSGYSFDGDYHDILSHTEKYTKKEFYKKIEESFKKIINKPLKTHSGIDYFTIREELIKQIIKDYRFKKIQFQSEIGINLNIDITEKERTQHERTLKPLTKILDNRLKETEKKLKQKRKELLKKAKQKLINEIKPTPKQDEKIFLIQTLTHWIENQKKEINNAEHYEASGERAKLHITIPNKINQILQQIDKIPQTKLKTITDEILNQQKLEEFKTDNKILK